MQLGEGAVVVVLGLIMTSGEGPFVVLWPPQWLRLQDTDVTRLTVPCSWPGLELQKGLRAHDATSELFHLICRGPGI